MSDIRQPTSYVSPSLRPFIEMLLGEDLLGITLIDAETGSDTKSEGENKLSNRPADVKPTVLDQERFA